MIWDSSAISTHRAPGSLYGTAAGPAGSAPPPAADAGNTRFDAGRIAESVGGGSRVLLPSLPEAEFFKYDTDAPAVNTGNEAVNARSRSEADGSAAAFLAEGETTLAEVAQRVEDFADAAAFPAPPQFEPVARRVASKILGTCLPGVCSRVHRQTLRLLPPDASPVGDRYGPAPIRTFLGGRTRELDRTAERQASHRTAAIDRSSIPTGRLYTGHRRQRHFVAEQLRATKGA